jgi:signal transduction histidine kinase
MSGGEDVERAVEVRRRSPGFGSPAVRLWIAAALVAALPLITFFAFTEIAERKIAMGAEINPEAIARTFARDDTVTNRLGVVRSIGEGVVARDVAAVSAPAKATVPALHAPALAEHQRPVVLGPARPASVAGALWQTPVVLGTFAIYAAFVGLALALIIGVARRERSSADLLPSRAEAASAEHVSADLRRLAEQVRLDVADTVHAMRSPLGVIAGSMDAIRRTIPREDARALRAVQLVELATERLVTTVDGSWLSVRALSSFFLAPWKRVDLGRILLNVAGRSFGEAGSPSNRIRFCVDAECPVSAPDDVLEFAVEGLLRTLCDVLPADLALTVAVFCEGEEVCLEVRGPGDALEKAVAPLVPPDTTRTISLLGGRVKAGAFGQDGRSIRLVLPRRG